jgi:hypothetical protein
VNCMICGTPSDDLVCADEAACRERIRRWRPTGLIAILPRIRT